VVRVKICGLRSRADVSHVAGAGADYAGFVFYPGSPRSVTLGDAAWIAGQLPDGLIKVALTVDADNSQIEDILAAIPVDMLQLHGQETTERVAEVRQKFQLPVMKVVGIATEEDLDRITEYERVSDQILLDARPMPGAELPGGNGVTFDWQLLQRWRRWSRPWMLAGGLTPENVAEAIRLTGAQQVDVSSGVEEAPGRKDHARITEFIAMARAG
jgi:phosphoribosylanthranilate isomerase